MKVDFSSKTAALYGTMRESMNATVEAAEPHLPKNYRLVYDVILEHGRGRHLSMGDVYAYARERQPSIGFTTVYRGLARLRNMSLISEILLPGAESAYYEPLADSHAHFRCDACGTVMDIDYRLPKDVAKSIGKAHDLDVDVVQLSFHGRCTACR